MTPTSLTGFNTADTNFDMRFEAVSPLPTTNTFTIMRWSGGWGGTNRVAQFDNSDGTRKLLLPVDLSQANCNGDRCLRGKFLVTAVTAHPWHANSAYPAEGEEGYPENGWPEAGPGTRATPSLVGFTFMGEAGRGGWRALHGSMVAGGQACVGRLRSFCIHNIPACFSALPTALVPPPCSRVQATRTSRRMWLASAAPSLVSPRCPSRLHAPKATQQRWAKTTAGHSAGLCEASCWAPHGAALQLACKRTECSYYAAVLHSIGILFPQLIPQAYYVVAQKYFPGASEAGTCTGTVYTPNGTDQIAANVRGQI